MTGPRIAPGGRAYALRVGTTLLVDIVARHIDCPFCLPGLGHGLWLVAWTAKDGGLPGRALICESMLTPVAQGPLAAATHLPAGGRA